MDIQQQLQDWLAHYQQEKAEIEKDIEKGNQNRQLLQVKYRIACRAQEKLSHRQSVQSEFYKKHIEKLETDYHFAVDNHDKILEESRNNLRYVEAMIQEIESTIAEYSA
ncbi:hypothetical protein [Priestia aryabhattai]|uniref:hypothetical protein n=1 Tax=Priestia aryabhattai TaxID=412384 RepID=UPI001C8DEF87|nr:hypothetical protein [Priestia aryabhattai]MBY0214119.1 hypothetical protein [Priestia aryabhattai]